ncbi:MAG: 3-methyl-2-oxobutanoate hydroxymethyltransferase, partial [Mycobacterium sp.]
MSEETVYGTRPLQSSDTATAPRTKVRVHHLQKMKAEGHKWA